MKAKSAPGEPDKSPKNRGAPEGVPRAPLCRLASTKSKQSSRWLAGIAAAAMSILPAAGCAVPTQASGDGIEACDNLQGNIYISNIPEGGFVYKSVFDYFPPGPGEVTLDCEIEGLSDNLVDSCGGQPELAIFGTVTVQENGEYVQKEVMLGSQKITQNGAQHLVITFDQQFSTVSNFSIAITGPGGAPVISGVDIEPQMKPI